MTSWATELATNLYYEAPRFGPSYQDFNDEHNDHMQVQNLRERFPTAEAMETHFREQYQALENRRER